MIVVVNPSGAAGQSFKGLAAYCAHDAGSSASSERVAWTSTRNIEADPDHAWKIMAATAAMAESLKMDAGVKAGRKTKHGPVMHLVMSYTDEEPTDRRSVERDIDQMLSRLGADPARMRGKAKPKRRQFADEHQVQAWAHEDTDAFHVHIAINTVHPEHGIRLPTSNNYRKLQKWALDYSKSAGTDHLTPAREENAAARQNGEFVKHPDRQNRKAFEQMRSLETALGSKKRAELVAKEQKAKDRVVYESGRSLRQQHQLKQVSIEERYLKSIAESARLRRRDENKAKAETREKYRPVWRQLADKQVHEFETFEALERSFFGRTKNILKTIRQNGSDEKSNLARAFRIISSADDRRKHLEKAQSRERTEVQIEINESLNRSSELAKAKDVERLALARANFKREMMDFRQERAQDLKGQGESWRRRNAERNAVFQKAIVMNRASSSLRETYDRVAEPDPGIDDVAGLISEYGLEFDRASQGSKHASTDATSKQKQKQ